MERNIKITAVITDDGDIFRITSDEGLEALIVPNGLLEIGTRDVIKIRVEQVRDISAVL